MTDPYVASVARQREHERRARAELYRRSGDVIPLPLTNKKEPAPLDRPGSVTQGDVPPMSTTEGTAPARAELDMGEGFDAIRAHSARAKLAEVAGTLDLPDASSMSVARHAGEAARLAHSLSQKLECLARNTSPEDEGIGQALLDVDRIDGMLWRIRSAAIAEQKR